MRKVDGPTLNHKTPAIANSFAIAALSPMGHLWASLMTDCQPPYTADSDFSLMADWACQHSHHNLQFDLLQAEPFDSRDSYCHPQSKQ